MVVDAIHEDGRTARMTEQWLAVVAGDGWRAMTPEERRAARQAPKEDPPVTAVEAPPIDIAGAQPEEVS